MKTRNTRTSWRLCSLPRKKRRNSDWIILTARHSTRGRNEENNSILTGVTYPHAHQSRVTLTRFAQSFSPFPPLRRRPRRLFHLQPQFKYELFHIYFTSLGKLLGYSNAVTQWCKFHSTIPCQCKQIRTTCLSLPQNG